MASACPCLICESLAQVLKGLASSLKGSVTGLLLDRQFHLSTKVGRLLAVEGAFDVVHKDRQPVRPSSKHEHVSNAFKRHASDSQVNFLPADCVHLGL